MDYCKPIGTMTMCGINGVGSGANAPVSVTSNATAGSGGSSAAIDPLADPDRAAVTPSGASAMPGFSDDTAGAMAAIIEQLTAVTEALGDMVAQIRALTDTPATSAPSAGMASLDEIEAAIRGGTEPSEIAGGAMAFDYSTPEAAVESVRIAADSQRAFVADMEEALDVGAANGAVDPYASQNVEMERQAAEALDALADFTERYLEYLPDGAALPEGVVEEAINTGRGPSDLNSPDGQLTRQAVAGKLALFAQSARDGNVDPADVIRFTTELRAAAGEIPAAARDAILAGADVIAARDQLYGQRMQTIATSGLEGRLNPQVAKLLDAERAEVAAFSNALAAFADRSGQMSDTEVAAYTAAIQAAQGEQGDLSRLIQLAATTTAAA